MRPQLFNQLKTFVLNIKDKNEQPVFKHFDLWSENLIHIEQEQPFYTPAVFVEFPPIQWKTLPHLNREAVVQFHLHILVHVNSPIPTQPNHTGTTALDALAFSDILYQGLQKQFANLPSDNDTFGFTFGLSFHPLPAITINTLTIEESEIEHDFEELLHLTDTYSCHITDRTATPKLQKHQAKPKVKVKISS